MAERKCGNCKFWGRQIKKYRGAPPKDQAGEWRQCGRIEHDRDNATFDDTDEWWDEDYKKERIDHPLRLGLAVVTDGSGYFAALKSRADFGCELFEPIEE